MLLLICLVSLAGWSVMLGRHLIRYYFQQKVQYFKSTIGDSTHGMEG